MSVFPSVCEQNTCDGNFVSRISPTVLLFYWRCRYINHLLKLYKTQYSNIYSINLLAELSFVTLTIHLCNGLNDKNLVKPRKTCFITVSCVTYYGGQRKYDFGYIRNAFKLMNLPVYNGTNFFKLLY